MSYSVKIAQGSSPCNLGEAPHWDEVREQLLFVDVLHKFVYRYVPKTKECYRVSLDGRVSLVLPVEGEGNKYLIAVEREIQVMDWDGTSSMPNSVKTLYTVDTECKTNRFNDGKCDTDGRLWAGTMGKVNPDAKTVDPKKGSLYNFTLDGRVIKQLDAIDIANGLAWSADDKLFYYIDSFTFRVDVFDYNAESGTISNRRPAFDLKANGIEGIPDGMTIDSHGNLWIAIFNGGKVIHVDPYYGKILGEIILPTRMITSVTFGGPNLEVLYITSATPAITSNVEKDEKGVGELVDGALFEVTNLGVRGLSAGYNYKGIV